MEYKNQRTEHLKRLSGALSLLEPFILLQEPLCGVLEYFVRFANEYLPLEGLGIIRMDENGSPRETAVWENGHIASEKDLAARGRIHVAQDEWKQGLTPDGMIGGSLLQKVIAIGKVPPEKVEGLKVAPILYSEKLLGLLVAQKESGGVWTDEDKYALRTLAQTAQFALVNENNRETYFEQTWILDELMDNLRTYLYVTDPQTDEILFMNKTMKKAFGLTNPEGEICWKVLQKNMTGRCTFCPVEKLMKGGKEVPYVQWEEYNTVTGRNFENYDSLMHWLDGRLVHFQQSADITASKKMARAATFDELTGMYNRRAGKEALDGALKRAKKEGRLVTVCLYDVNLLKDVNDTYGHMEGDNLLCTIAGAVRNALEGADFSFRLSGDEFMIVLYGRDQKTAAKIMRKIQEQLLVERERGKKPYEISFCYGIAEVGPDDLRTMKDIIAEVDEKMYAQKRKYHSSRLNRQKNAQLGKIEFSYDKEHLYEALIGSTDDYIYICNMQTNVFRFPPAMVEEFNLPGEIIYDATPVWGALIHEESKQAFYDSMQDMADGRTDIHDLVYRVRNREGEWVKIHCRGRVHRDQQGNACLFAGIITHLD